MNKANSSLTCADSLRKFNKYYFYFYIDTEHTDSTMLKEKYWIYYTERKTRIEINIVYDVRLRILYIVLCCSYLLLHNGFGKLSTIQFKNSFFVLKSQQVYFTFIDLKKLYCKHYICSAKFHQYYLVINQRTNQKEKKKKKQRIVKPTLNYSFHIHTVTHI